MTWKNTARLPENLCSAIVILKSDVTRSDVKLLNLSHPVVLLKEIKASTASEHLHFVIECSLSNVQAPSLQGKQSSAKFDKRCRIISMVCRPQRWKWPLISRE